jgi:predicted nucleic acid-binding Zn ribbon protein
MNRRIPRPLNTLIEDALGSFPDQKRIKRGKVLHAWPEVVGPQFARVSRNVHFERDDLVVEVPHASWRNELQMNRLEIVDRLNRAAGADVVKQLIVRA